MTKSVWARAARWTKYAAGFALATAVLTVMPASLPQDASAFFQSTSVMYSGLQGTKKLALTLDDGPSNATETVLNVLKEHGIKATFFVVGQRVDSRPDLMARMRDEGHVIANHSFSHPALGGAYVRKPHRLINQIGRTHEKIERYVPAGQGLYFRAPYGVWRRAHAEVLNADPVLRNYVGPIYWDIGGYTGFDAEGNIRSAADWSCWSRDLTASECATGYMREIRRKKGGVVLMHDVRQRTAQMLAIMVPKLIEDGYSFVTLDEIPAYDPLKTPKDQPVAGLRGSFALAALR